MPRPTTRPSSAASKSVSNRAPRSPATRKVAHDRCERHGPRGSCRSPVRARAGSRRLRNTAASPEDARMGQDTSQTIVDLRTPLAGDPAQPAADRLLAGSPRQTVANYFSDVTEQFFAGRWTSSPGKWRIRYTESEFCCLTEGLIALENSQGQRWQFGPGAAFVVPAGFEGTWEVIETCTKFYAIFEART